MVYSNLNRGVAWALLGYLQTFIFGNIGYIDPVHKVALKLRYVEEDIADCEKTIYVATLYSRILGLMDNSTLHPRLKHIQDSQKNLTTKKNSLSNLKAVRPSNTEFIALSKEFTNFKVTLGSYAIVNKHMQQLIQAITKLENKNSVNNIECVRIAAREAEIWLESVLRFMDQIEAKYLSGYPDIVLPILSGLAQMRHGIRILKNESSRHIATAELNVGSKNLEFFLLNLMRFPTIGPEQEEFLKLVNLSISLESRKLLSIGIKSENTFVVLQEQFKLMITGLYEFYNYVVMKGKLTKDLWLLLNGLLQQISLIWQQQQNEIERREVEKDNLYKINLRAQQLTEEEKIAQELMDLFPTQRQNDFEDISNIFTPSLEKNIKVESRQKEFDALITKKQIKEVQDIHSNIVRCFTNSEWLCKDVDGAHPDFIEPLLKRCSTFGLLLDNVRSTLNKGLTTKLYTSLNVLTQIAARVGLAEKLNPEGTLNAIRNNDNPYDYYRDSNVEEIKQCMPLLEGISRKISELVKEWPDHPTLMSLKVILQRIYSFPVTSAVSRFLTGLELLLLKMHEWEENAHSGVTLTDHILALTQQIISWRKLELTCWKDCLTTTQLRLRSHTSKWWFFLYALFDDYLTKNRTSDTDNFDEGSITSKKLIESLEIFMNTSPLIEFEARLELIFTFHCHTYYLNPCIERDELLAISWNIYHYYKQFLSDVNNKIKLIKDPIEKKLKDFVKIARWNDISYWAVKETVEKTHRTLHKFIKEYENSLKDLVTSYLIVKPSYKSETGIWDYPENSRNYDINPNNYVVNTPKYTLDVISFIKSDLITRADTHYLLRATKLCKEAILMSSYPNLRVFFEEFIEEFLNHSIRLRDLEIDRTLPKPKQISQAKSILQQKRMALSIYFKTLVSFGVSYRIGILKWNNELDEIMDFTIPPLNVKAALNSMKLDSIERQTLDHWDGVERYYYGSLIRLNALNHMLLTNKTDLGAQNMEWCKGFSMHLMLMANKQKKTLTTILKYLVNLRSQILDLSSMDDDMLIRRQVDLWNSANNLKELLITARTCLEQFLIYLQACPSGSQGISEDYTYSLANNDLAIVTCKKGDAIWEKANSYIKECLSVILNISKKFDTIFPELPLIYKKNYEREIQISIMTSKHFAFLKESFISLKSVMEILQQFAAMFYTEDKKHPLIENIIFLETSITKRISEFHQIMISSEKQMESDLSSYKDDCDQYESNLEKLVNMVLIVIQDKYKNNLAPEIEYNDENSDSSENLNKRISEDEYEQNKLREKLIESIEADMKALKLKEIYVILNGLLKTIFDADSDIYFKYCKLLKKCLPLLQQYLLLVQFYLNEQVASLRITCKILYMQLNVFLDLATNGFCVPKDLNLEESEEGSEEQSGRDGMGLGDGEGEKDVSDRIETEDQLDDAKPAGQEDEKVEDKECPEEDKGIEMSENFEGKLQDLEKEDDTGSNDEKDDENIDKEMGETNAGADKLDEQIWGDDEDEPENKESNKDEDEIGDGERIGEKQFGNKDDKNEQDHEDQDNNENDTKKEQQKEINEMEEPEYDEDHVNPYHGKHQPEPEPDPLELPEDMNMEDDDERNDEQDNEENPFDIDKMKETMAPPETQETETTENEETKDDNDKHDDSSDDENESEKEKVIDTPEKESEAKDDENIEKATEETSETNKENKEEENLEETEKDVEDEAMPSTDEPSKEIDASNQIDERNSGSRDQVASGTENEEDSKEESNAENWQDEKKDKGTGQSQAEQHSSGHSGSSSEKINRAVNQDVEEKQNEKRKHPGKSDENHALADQLEPDKKKLKTMIHAQEKLLDDDNNEEGIERDENNDQDMCQHVKEKEKFDHYAMDAATEEQSKEQASNRDQKEEVNDDEKSMDIEMHEDEEVEIVDDENIQKQNPEKLSNENKSNESSDPKEKGRVQDGQLETIVDIEGETMKTMKIMRGTESTFFTNITEIETEFLSTMQIEKRRTEIEKMLSQWSHVPTTEEAIAAWNTLSAITDASARDLSEKLRLVLEPTQASRLRGDYRTGKRINMRKIIPYIASQFRKDKIWLRRTKPSKRDYQIVLAIDDSSSMSDNHSKELAFESLSLISKAMTYLEVGQLSVLSFGEQTNILHPLGEPFNEKNGSRLMQEMSFEQKKTMVGQLVDFTVDMFQSQCNSMDNAKLLVVLSDGRGVFSEGMEKVNCAVRRARIADIFLVFIIVDNPLNKDSILDIRMPVFQGGKLTGINSYMDSFPFPFYMILRDINALPGVLSDALRQWFEVVGKIDT